MALDLEKYRVKLGEQVNLADVDPGDTGGLDSKDERKEDLDQLTKELEALQERLYAEHRHAVLIVLQGMDTSGKDGTIRHVFDGVNPQGVRVASFKAPTLEELAHDFLWRIHQQTPAKGEIVIFNRSHYEDVLIVRVHNLISEAIWSKRYGHINNFEHMLVDEGTTILKFFLHISRHEQKQRLLDRLEKPDKLWKFNPEDLKERDYWQDYTHAYEDMLGLTSTEWAPWYIVPSNHKWYRNLVVASRLVQTLLTLDPQYPDPIPQKEVEKYRAEIQKE